MIVGCFYSPDTHQSISAKPWHFH